VDLNKGAVSTGEPAAASGNDFLAIASGKLNQRIWTPLGGLALDPASGMTERGDKHSKVTLLTVSNYSTQNLLQFASSSGSVVL